MVRSAVKFGEVCSGCSLRDCREKYAQQERARSVHDVSPANAAQTTDFAILTESQPRDPAIHRAMDERALAR
jgi:hypothetical protein